MYYFTTFSFNRLAGYSKIEQHRFVYRHHRTLLNCRHTRATGPNYRTKLIVSPLYFTITYHPCRLTDVTLTIAILQSHRFRYGGLCMETCCISHWGRTFLRLVLASEFSGIQCLQRSFIVTNYLKVMQELTAISETRQNRKWRKCMSPGRMLL